MSISVTLQVSESVLERARDEAARTGQEVEIVLSEWLEKFANEDEKLPFERGVTYPIYTPYGGEAAAKVLYDMLEAGTDTKDELDQDE
jgi:hypothetical protein